MSTTTNPVAGLVPRVFCGQKRWHSVKNFLRGSNGIDKAEPGYGFSLAGIIAGDQGTSPWTPRGTVVLVVLVVFEAKVRGTGTTDCSTGYSAGLLSS